MNITSLLLLALLAFSQSQVTKRHILLNPQNRLWLSEDKISKLASHPDFHYMDITDTPNLEQGKVPPVSPLPPYPKQQNFVKHLNSRVNETKLREIVSSLQNFKSRYYDSENGVKAAFWLYNEYKKIIDQLPVQRRDLFNVRFFNHTQWKQPSVIIKMRGRSTNQTLRNELVIIGAHLDSINRQNLDDAPGADDNASGSATLLEIFRILANSNFLPLRSVEFHCYAAEEVGLRGSQEIAQMYKNLGIPVYGMLNFDLTGYNNQGKNTIGVLTDQWAHSELSAFLKQLVKEYSNYGVGELGCPGGFPCSDHASFTRAGYRSCSPVEAADLQDINPNMHTSKDVIDILDFKRALGFVRIGVAFAVELGYFTQ